MVPDPNSMTLSTTYTVAICTYNRSSLLDRCLNALTNIKLNETLRILIVDNGSTDSTRDLCQKYKGTIEYIFESNIGLSHARNRAIMECNTDYLIFLDDDAIPDASWLLGVEDAIANSADVFGGPYTPYYLSEKPAWFLDEFGSAHLDHAEGRQIGSTCFSGGNMGWRVSLLNDYGGFDPNLGMKGNELRLAEETALQLKIKRDRPQTIFWFSPRMSMKHFVSQEKMSLSYIIRRNFEYGRTLKFIDPDAEIMQKTSLQMLVDARFGLPLIYRIITRDKSETQFWKTYAARYLTIHSIRAGIISGRFL